MRNQIASLIYFILVFQIFACNDLTEKNGKVETLDANSSIVNDKKEISLRDCKCELAPWAETQISHDTSGVVQKDFDVDANLELKISDFLKLSGVLQNGKVENRGKKLFTKISNEFSNQFEGQIFDYKVTQNYYCATYMSLCKINSISDLEFSQITKNLNLEIKDILIGQKTKKGASIDAILIDNYKTNFHVVSDFSLPDKLSTSLINVNIREVPLLTNNGKVVGKFKAGQKVNFLNLRTQEVEELKISDKFYKSVWYKIQDEDVKGWVYGGCLNEVEKEELAIVADTLNAKEKKPGKLEDDVEYNVYRDTKNRLKVSLTGGLQKRKPKFDLELKRNDKKTGIVEFEICISEDGEVRSRKLLRKMKSYKDSHINFAKDFVSRIKFDRNKTKIECGKIILDYY